MHLWTWGAPVYSGRYDTPNMAHCWVSLSQKLSALSGLHMIGWWYFVPVPSDLRKAVKKNILRWKSTALPLASIQSVRWTMRLDYAGRKAMIPSLTRPTPLPITSSMYAIAILLWLISMTSTVGNLKAILLFLSATWAINWEKSYMDICVIPVSWRNAFRILAASIVVTLAAVM